MDALDYAKALLDPDRLGVAGLVAEALRTLARTASRQPPPDRTVRYGMTGDEQAVLARFFRGRRLVDEGFLDRTGGEYWRRRPCRGVRPARSGQCWRL